MWIRSQDKSRLIKASGLRVVNGKDFICIKDDNGHILGVYSTKEKALKVLDMVQERVCKIEAFKIQQYAMERMEIWNINTSGYVFQMPQDDEVVDDE